MTDLISLGFAAAPVLAMMGLAIMGLAMLGRRADASRLRRPVPVVVRRQRRP